MTKKRGVMLVLIVMLGLGFTVAEDAWGQRGWRRSKRTVPARRAPARPAGATRSPYRLNPYGYDPYYYSKYYGGFHARYFNEGLYPNGGRPIRGTAW
jgi:hypothetical protein